MPGAGPVLRAAQHALAPEAGPFERALLADVAGVGAGLDPIGAAAFDVLIPNLSESLGLTVFMITHDLDSLYAICDRVAVLADKHIVAHAPIKELEKSDHPWIK